MLEGALSCALPSWGTSPAPRPGTRSVPAAGCGAGEPGSWGEHVKQRYQENSLFAGTVSGRVAVFC